MKPVQCYYHYDMRILTSMGLCDAVITRPTAAMPGKENGGGSSGGSSSGGGGSSSGGGGSSSGGGGSSSKVILREEEKNEGITTNDYLQCTPPKTFSSFVGSEQNAAIKV